MRYQRIIGLAGALAILGWALGLGTSVEAQDLAVSLDLETGVYWGQALEIVYKSPHQPDKLSLLTWKLPLLQTLGLSAQAVVGPGVFLRLRSALGIPYGSTTMTDWDWNNVPDTASPEVFSDSTSYLVGWYRTAADLGWRFVFTDWLATAAFLTYLHQFCAWEGWNSTQGQSGNPNLTTYYGHTIDYRQTWHGLAAGALTWFSPPGPTRAELLLRYYPWLAFLSRDIHILTGKTYLDWAYFGQGLEGALGFRFRVERWSVHLGVETLWLWSAYGDSLLSLNGDTDPNAVFSLSRGTIGGTFTTTGLFVGLGLVLE